jgi:hypothetical protein
MSRNLSLVLRAMCLVVLASLAGCHSCRGKGLVTPVTVTPGVDAFQTSTTSATRVDFSANPIPAGFFCPGSPPFSGSIDLQGVPLDTTPPGIAGNSDTLVERLNDASVGGGGATIQVRVRALRLAGVNPISIPCPGKPPNWRVDVCTCGAQPTTDITVKVDQDCGCGHFDGTLSLKTCLRFTNDDATVVGPITQPVKLTIRGMPWCPKPIPGALVIGGEFSVKDCQGGSQQLRGTSNFFPGYSCNEQQPGVDCWTKFKDLTHCHEGPTPDHPHCINPVCGKRG